MKTPIYVAPSEPPTIKTLGRSSTKAEPRGVDILWRTEHGWFGVQRKEVKDFLASVRDGRITKEVAQMRAGVEQSVIVIEGRVQFINGVLSDSRYGPEWTEDAWWSMMFSLAHEDVHVFHTRDKLDTVAVVSKYIKWSEQNHTTFRRRPAPVTVYGKPDNKDYSSHLLQGIMGLGPETAEAILDHFGFLPIAWIVTAEELQGVKGIAKTRAEQYIAAVGYAGVKP